MLKRFLAVVVALAMVLTMTQSLVMAEDSEYIKEYTHNFNSWSSNYYGYYGWRNGGGGSTMNTSIFANGMKYGAATKSVQFINGVGTGGYFDASKYTDITLTDENKYFRLSFDIAADTTDAAVKIFNGDSGTNTAQFFRIENGKMIFAMNTNKTVDLEAKRWYSVDIIECYENNTATWSAYVDGVKVFDNGTGFKFTQLGKVNVIKQSAAEFSIDNVTFAVSNYEPEITADEIELASSDASNVKIQNTYPRLVSVKTGTTVAGLVDTLSGADSYVVTDAASTVIEDTTAEVTGNYLRVVLGSDTYVYPIDTWTIPQYIKEYTHNFNAWSSNYYGYNGWRNGAGGSTMNTTHFANGKKYGAATNSVQFVGESGSSGYFDATKYTDIALTDENKYFRFSFDIAAETTDAAVKIYNGNSGTNNAQFFRIENGKMIFAMNTTNTVDLEAKRWYSIDIVECYENATASWSAYVDGVKVFDGATGFKFTKLDRVNVVKQSAIGADFSIDNVTFAVSNYEPEITADEIELASSDASNVKIQNTYPRLVSVKAGTTVAGLVDTLSGADSYVVTDAASTVIEDTTAEVTGNYLRVVLGSDTYIYPIDTWVIEPYIKEYTHNFNGWSSNYYGYYGWRNGAAGSTMDTNVFTNVKKYGAATNSVQFINGVGTGGYFDASKYTDITLTDENKYFRLSFDIAADTTDAAVKIFNGDSGTNTAQFFRIENGKMYFAMNTNKTVDLEAKRWYSVDIIECYENNTATWSAYVDGVKVFDNGTGFKFTQLGKVNVIKQSAKGTDFSIDNVGFAVSNYEPEITADEFELTVADNTKFAIKNSFPRKLVADSTVKVSDISSAISNQGATITYLDENSNALTDDAVAFGKYMNVTYEGKTYIYPIGGFSIKDNFDNKAQKITSTLSSTKLGTLGYSETGLYGKASDDLSFTCTGATNETQAIQETKWLVFKPETYGYTTTSLPQTYSVELAINDDFGGSLAWAFKPQVGDTVGATKFAVSLSATEGVNFFDTENVCRILPNSWIKVDMVIYPADKKIDFYIDGVKTYTETFTGEGLLVPNAGTMRICASNIPIGETAYWAADNFNYYIGEPSYAQTDIPAAEFSGKMMFGAANNNVDEVVIEGVYQSSDATPVNESTISSYVDSEGVTTVVAAKNGIYKYYKITEIDGINLLVNDAETTTLSTGTVSANAIISKTSLSDYKPTLVLAVYEDGKLVDIISDDIMSEKKLEASLEVTKGEKTTVKAMLWSGLETLVPLTATVSAN